MREADIRPSDLFDTFLSLVERDARKLVEERRDFVEIACPGCGTADARTAFAKWGYRYARCASCGTLYCSPRPSEAAMEWLYGRSESVRFWSTDFYRKTEEARRERLFRPRAALVAEWADRAGLPAHSTFVDVGAGYGVLLEEVARVGRFSRIVGVEPSPALAETARDRGFEILESTAEGVPEGRLGAGFATSLEVLEHVFDPLRFLTGVRRLLVPGGVLLLTTLTASGFDVRVLGPDAKCIHPPHHVNFLTVDGVAALLKRAGFEAIEVTTPGKLDVEIVRNRLVERPHIDVDDFVRHLCLEATDATRAAFQKFLGEHNLSSHLRVVARVPTTLSS